MVDEPVKESTGNLLDKNGSDRSHSGLDKPKFPDFSKLTKAQDILDRNKRILHTIKVNHDSQRPEALAKNFALLSEVHENIETVQQVYLQIEEDYVGFMKSQNGPPGGKTTS